MNNSFIVLYIIEFILMFFMSFTFILSVKIVKNWDYKSLDLKQYDLLDKVYLSSILTSFVLVLKIILFFLFLYAIDDLSNVIIGAMCSTGVFLSAKYGFISLFMKSFVIILCLLWFLLFIKNQNSKNMEYTKKVYMFFIVLYIFAVFEFFLSLYMFLSINTDKVVSCCSTIFSQASSSSYSQVLFSLNDKYILVLFIISFLLTFFKNRYLLALFGSMFFVITILSIISYFSPYIYELPSHKCPFCIFKKEYYYIAYLLYSLCFISFYLSISNLFLFLFIKNENKNIYKYIRILNSILFFVLFSYVLIYYLKNGVFL